MAAVTTIRPPITSSYKTVILGDSGVGKTSLVTRLTTPMHLPINDNEAVTTGIEFSTHILDTRNGKVKAQIWDTAGEEKFARILLSTYLRKTKGIILVYDITDAKSFANLNKYWIPEMDKHKLNSNVVKLLVGNKCDQETSREISRERAQQFCSENDMEMVETSAKDGESVLNAFEKLIFRVHDNTLFKGMFVETGFYQKDISRPFSKLEYNDSSPKTWARTRGANGRVPFASALANSLKWSCIKGIFALNMPAIYEIDGLTGMPLCMLAAVGANSDIETIYNLLKEFPGAVRIMRN